MMMSYHSIFQGPFLLVGCLMYFSLSTVFAISDTNKQSVLVYFEDLTVDKWSDDLFKESVADILNDYCCGGDTEQPTSCGLESCSDSDSIATDNVEIYGSPHSYGSVMFVVKTYFNLMDGSGVMEQSLLKDILTDNMDGFDSNFHSYPVKYIMTFNYDTNVIIISVMMVLFVCLLLITVLLHWNHNRSAMRMHDERISTSDQSLAKSGVTGGSLPHDLQSVPEVLYLPPPPPPPPRDSSHRREKAIKRVRSEMERDKPPGTAMQPPNPPQQPTNNDVVKMKAPLLQTLNYEDEMAAHQQEQKPAPPIKHHRKHQPRTRDDVGGSSDQDRPSEGEEGEPPGTVRHRKRHHKKSKKKTKTRDSFDPGDGMYSQPPPDTFLMNDLSGTDQHPVNLPPIESHHRDLPPIYNHNGDTNY